MIVSSIIQNFIMATSVFILGIITSLYSVAMYVDNRGKYKKHREVEQNAIADSQ